MNGTITGGSTPINPSIILGLSEQIPGGTVVHPILGRIDPDVTLRPAAVRTGTLELGFTASNAETASFAAVNALRSAAVFRLAAERGTLAMAFVVPENGRIERRLDDTTRSAWTVTVDYQEVIA